jgi:hypothetical protein
VQTAQLLSVLLQGTFLLVVPRSDVAKQVFIAMSGIAIDILEGMESLPAMPGMAQLGAAPLRNIPSARTNVTICRAKNRTDMV